MNEASPKQLKSDWQLDAPAFHQLLTYLDEGNSSEGQRYLQMRERLVAYFDRKNCLNPDELADQTLNRVARRLQEEGQIQSETAAKYCYTVARYIFHEHLRRSEKEDLASSELWRRANSVKITAPPRDDPNREGQLQCLESCVSKLDIPSQQIISQYYIGNATEKIANRRKLAEQLGISPNALSIRACRIREKLEICVRRCAESN
jgi:DNA-directed RNA polymerase specialized sigma24 family protein